jgi:hypothetical protein
MDSNKGLFNVYVNDLPVTQSHKFMYADDIALGIQSRSFHELDGVLNKDLEDMTDFFKKWRLQPSATKTVTSVIHLNNANANRELCVLINGQQIKHDPIPTYLGMTLDRSLTFYNHLKKTAAKLSTRNNILHKLAVSTWGASVQTPKTSALDLCYSTAQYCALVWAGSSPTKLFDVQTRQQCSRCH